MSSDRRIRAAAGAVVLLVKPFGTRDELTALSDVAASPRQEGNDTRHGRNRGRNRKWAVFTPAASLACQRSARQGWSRNLADLLGRAVARSGECSRVTVAGLVGTAGRPAADAKDPGPRLPFPRGDLPVAQQVPFGSRRSAGAHRKSPSSVARRGNRPGFSQLPLSAPRGLSGRPVVPSLGFEHPSTASADDANGCPWVALDGRRGWSV